MKPPLGIQLQAGHPLAKGLVGCWLFNEAPSALGKVYDLSGNGNHGTLVGEAHSAANFDGSGLDTDAAADYVSLTNTITMPRAPWSFSWKANIRTITASHYLWGHLYSAGNYDRCSYSTAGKLFVWDSDNTITAAANAFMTVGIHHYVVVLDGTNVHFYKDGALFLTDTEENTGIWRIKRLFDRGNSNISPDAITSHFSIYNRALSAQEVLSLYNDPFQMFEEEV